LVRRIRELLYEEGFTISGARNRLIEKGSKAKLNADLIAQASAEAALGGLVAFPPDLFAPLEVQSEALSEGLRQAEGVAVHRAVPLLSGSASGLDLIEIRRELKAALDLLNFDGKP
jgi:hypothetical protein